MKKLLCKIIAVAMAATVLVGITPPNKVEAASDTTIPVTVVDDINYEAVNEKAVGDSFKDLTREESEAYKRTYSFTLAKPAYVKTSVYSTLSHENYTHLGANVRYRISYNAAGSNLVKSTETKTVPGREYDYYYLMLDAGTYYINVELAQDDERISDGYYNISVIAQYSDAITRNVTKAKAATISTDKLHTGIITATTRNSWYKFNVPSDCTVSINSWLESAWSTDRGNVIGRTMAVTLWNERNQIVAFWNNSVYSEGYTKQNINLKKGTYYLSFYGGQYYGYDRDYDDSNTEYNTGVTKELKTGSTEAAKIRNGGEIKFKITTLKTPSGVKGTNQKGKKIKLTYKKVPGAKGYEIQYSTKKNFQSGVKQKTTTKTSYTIKKLTKNKKYYVRVRAWRYDDQGNKLYSDWVTKTVKVKK